MTARSRRCSAISLAALAMLAACSQAPPPPTAPRNVVLLIGDGMGLEQVRAGGLYANGAAGTLSFERFPVSSRVTTRSSDSPITDSAAAATAMATGRKVPNGAISMADGQELPTVLETERDRGKSTGLVTTAYVTHATPAAFAAHESARGSEDAIGLDLFTPQGPTFLLGGGGASHGISRERAEAAAYLVVTTRAELQSLSLTEGLRVSGQFGDGYLPYEYDGLGDLPSLTEMTRVAISTLSLDPDGFFVMIEGGRIDHASHANDAARMVGEVAAFDQAVAWVRSWSDADGETLVVVTADHETGGLTDVIGNGAGVTPAARWTTAGHTAADVGIWAIGLWSELLASRELVDNTAVYLLLRGELAPAAAAFATAPGRR